jgi:hypothetical protein
MLRAAQLCLTLAFPVLVIGCGSSSPHQSRSLAGLVAAEHELASDVQAGHYAKAWAAFTPKVHHRLDALGHASCAELVALGIELSRALCANPRVAAHSPSASCRHGKPKELLPEFPSDVQISGTTAYHAGRVEARYERGRWLFEGAHALTQAQRQQQAKAAFEKLCEAAPTTLAVKGQP